MTALFSTVTNAESTPIVPEDKFIVECVSLEEAPPYNPTGDPEIAKKAKPGIKWILGLFDPSTGEPFTFQGEPYEFFQTTTQNMAPGARARVYAEAFLGRTLAEGENLDPDMLLGKRCLGMVVHEFSRNDKTKKVAKLASTKPYTGKVGASSARPSNGTAVSANPSEADVDLALLRTKVEKAIARAEKLQTAKHLEWGAYALGSQDRDDLTLMLEAITADIDATLDG